MTSHLPRAIQTLQMCAHLVAAVALLFATALPIIAQQNPPLAITAPSTGTVVNPGQTFPVTVASPAGQTFDQVIVIGDGFFGFVGATQTLPAQFSVTVPANAALKTYSVSAAGGTGGGDPIVTTILIDVQRPDLPTAIRADVAQVVFAAQGQDSPTKIRATFSDGAVFDVTMSSNVTYISSNPDIAVVDADGIITGVGAGVAEVTATYTVSLETRRALIRVIVPPPPYTVTPNILHLGEQAVGATVGSQMTLTNSGGKPLTITAVVASSEFAASEDCVAASPLAEDATCTIIVTFTPEVTGLREGVLQISEPDDVVGFRLTGTGVQGQPVTIASFTPSSGPFGTPVTITGIGFSATPAENAVTFNGIAATVTSSTTTSINVTVPTGATTGPIAVTSPSGSATSAAPFTVTVPEPPTISGFSPTMGVAGTSVTISGTNFALVPANNQTKFNETTATPNGATSTTVTAPVPASSGSGRIRITTPAGTAVSTADFIVPPSPFVAADVATSGRIAFASPTPVTVSAANKIGLFLFDGVAGQRISLLGTNGLTAQILGCDINVSILKPNATVLAPATCMEQSGFIDVQTLPSTGTYTILVDPAGAATGGVTLTLYDVPADVSGTLTPGGPSVTATMPVPGQNGVLTFSGTAGQRVSLLGTNGMTGQVAFVCDVNVTIKKPDATVLVPATCMEGSGYVDVLTLPSTGTYQVSIDPTSWAVGNLTVRLYDVPADVTGTLTPGGSSVTATMSVPGQNGVLTFSGTAGQRISLLGTNGLTAQILGCDVNVTLKKPDATILVPATCMEGSGYIDVQTLPSTGTYQVFIDPISLAVGSLTLTLYDVPADVSGTLIPGGASVTATMSVRGQNAALTFSGTAGQRVSLRGTNGLTAQILGCDVNVTIKKPDATVLAPPACMEGSGFIDTKTLPATGTYTIFIDPVQHATGSLTLTLYDVPADATGTVSIGGSSSTVALSTPGQNGTLTFAGTSSQQVTVRLTSNVFGWVTVRLLRPDGTQVTSQVSFSGSFNLSTQTLPVTGTYTIVIDPSDANTGSIVVSVTSP
jgi:IPT/TIG domain-containing protein/Big-like domain-containing protein